MSQDGFLMAVSLAAARDEPCGDDAQREDDDRADDRQRGGGLSVTISRGPVGPESSVRC